MDITLGSTVTVNSQTDFWLSEIRAGRAQSAMLFQAASVGNFSEVQIHNPAPGTNVIVRLILVSLSAAAVVSLRQYNLTLATLLGNGVNLLSGAGQSNATLRAATPAALDGTEMGGVDVLAGTPTLVVPEWYIELSQGEGLIVAAKTVNVAVRAMILWREGV